MGVASEPIAEAVRVERRRGLGLLRNPAARVGLTLSLCVVIAALLAPLLAPVDPVRMGPARLALPSSEHWLGTDQFGRDLLSRLLYGARVSLTIALLSVGLAVGLGTLIGLVAGYVGGIVDQVLMRIMDVLLAFPLFLLALSVVALLGPNLPNLVVAIGLIYVATFARIMRGSVLSLAKTEFVEATRALGASGLHLVALVILPNALAPVIVQATFNLSTAIMIEAALSFLGMGVQPPAPAWGVMLSEARTFMELDPWLAIAPGIAITISVLGFNLLGDGLRDLLDPRLVDE